MGFHKTGTSSLGRALELVGLRVAGPFQVRHRDIATRALPEARRRLAKVDAVQDNPWPLLYRELDAEWPGSRFILTVRDTDRWLASVLGHFGGRTTPMREWVYGEGRGDPQGNEERYRERYEQHNREVREHFADRPDDLLVLDLGAGDGWAELGAFLGVEVPDGSFPHVNSATRPNRALNALRHPVRKILRH